MSDDTPTSDSDESTRTARGGVSRRALLQSGAVASSGLVLPSGDAMATADDDSERRVRRFTIHAIPVEIVYNSFGVRQPQGAMFVLEENLDAARAASGEVPGDAFADLPDRDDDTDEDERDADDVDTSVIEPLVIRANVGDVVDIRFVNHLDRYASLHPTGLPYQVQTSDGMAVGHNRDTTVPPGQTRRYRWFAPDQGTFYFRDGVSQAFDSTPDGDPEAVNNLARGLFGALVVEPQGATWTDPETGDELRSGTRADIHDPAGLGTSYREFVVFYHDPGEMVGPDGEEITHPDSDVPQNQHAINYRGDQTGVRLQDRPDAPDATEEAGFYSSWVHGDPGGGDLVFEAYQNDPVKMVLVGGNLEENHSHHLHNHRWKEIPGNSDSDTIDAQTVGPGTTYETYLTIGHGNGLEETTNPALSFTEAFEAGVGGEHGTAGDVLFHCHLFPHYAEGMAGLLRINDQEQPDLQPLPNDESPVHATTDQPEFPEFVPGERGELQPAPPLVRGEETPAERAALGDQELGAPYADPCTPADVERVVEYDIVALPADIVYNDAGDHDPEGQVFVLEEDAEAVRNGEMNPEPLVIRANVGDCVRLRLRNELDREKSLHPHFVRYDLQGSDGLDMGYNYGQTVDPGEEREYRWFANEEGTIFFHDHATGIPDAMNGTFASIIVEPQGSEWLDPHTGEPVRSGTQAMINPPDRDPFREVALLFHDFAQLVDRDGEFVEPARQHDQNAGVMAVNYRNAPYYHRDDEDPAYLHSSYVHGDPETPVLEAYEGDPIRVRLVHGPWEEQHNFTVSGLSVDAFEEDPRDQTAQITNVSEAFTFRVSERDVDIADNPDGLPVRDYLYGSGIADDIWNGMWGIIRYFGGEVDHLQPLPGEDPPADRISEADLRAMGHPAPFATPEWTEVGHKAKLLYDADDDRARPPDSDDRRNDSVGERPPTPPAPGTPGPADADERVYEVDAIQTEIRYDEYGDVDPHGIVFAPREEADAILDGERDPEPLTLRVARDERVTVRLRNRLPADLDDDHADPEMRAEREWEPSSRISLHPLNARYDVQGSDGATVGFNYDGTVSPGEEITYSWAPSEGADGCVLWDFADIRGHRHHGAFGQLLVEPPGSTWLDPATAEPIETGTRAMVKRPDGDDFREFSLSWADGQFIVNEADPDDCVVPANPAAPEQDPDAPCTQLGDPEDQGYVSINYRAEPFARRFETDDAQHRVFDSDVHGDPATPVLRALVDDPVRFRVGQGADKPRGIAFHLVGHRWRRFRGADDEVVPTPRIGVEGDISPGKFHTVRPLDGAGGVKSEAGDYLYQGMKLRRRLEAGWWGIFRVGKTGNEFERPVHPLPDRSRGVPPAARPGWRVACGCTGGPNGNRDLLVGVPDSDATGPESGAAYLFFGRERVSDLADYDVRFVGADGDHRVGVDVTVRDGRVVVAVGPDRDTVARRYVFHDVGGLSGDVDLGEADEVVTVDGGEL